MTHAFLHHSFTSIKSVFNVINSSINWKNKLQVLLVCFILISVNIGFSQDNCCGAGKGDRVKSMTLLYTGESCTASNNSQGVIGDKWDCTGNPAGDNQVFIVVNDQNGTNTPTAARIHINLSMPTVVTV